MMATKEDPSTLLFCVPTKIMIMLQVSSSTKSENDDALSELKESLRDTPPAGPLVNLCKTNDQAKAVAQFIDALAEKQLK